MRFLCWEAAFALAYENLLGITYLSGLAGELGIDVWVLTLLAAMPWCGAIAQVFVLPWLSRAKSLRKTTLMFAGSARGIWLLPILFAGVGFAGWIRLDPRTWFLGTTVVVAVSGLLATSGGVTWLSWMHRLVPHQMMGRFWGTRQRYTMAAIIGSNLLAAWLVTWRPNGWMLGYATVALIGVGMGGLSSFLLAKVPEAPGPRFASDAWVGIGVAFKDVRFRRLMLFSMGFYFAVHLAAPFFPYYFTRDAGISMRTVAVWAVLANVGSLLASGFFGKFVDRLQSPIWVMFGACFVIALSPLPYLIQSSEILGWVGPIEYLFNGAAWAAFQITMARVVFRLIPEAHAASYFSLNTAVQGIAGLSANALGGWIAHLVEGGQGFRNLFMVGSMARFAALFLLLPLAARAFEGRRA